MDVQRRIRLLLALTLIGTMPGASPALGEEKKKPTIEVHVLDPDIDTQALEAKGFRVVPPGQAKSEPRPLPNRLPRVPVRNRDFASAGLAEEVASWDEAEKDILWMRARRLEPDQLVSRYPKVSREKLKSLSSLTKRDAR